MSIVGFDSSPSCYHTKGGISVHRHTSEIPKQAALESIIDKLDSHLGVLLSSTFEYPGRYRPWCIGFVDPPLQIVSNDRNFQIIALNDRGKVILAAIESRIRCADYIADLATAESNIEGTIKCPPRWFPEEYRSKQNTIFSLLRDIVDLFSSANDSQLGLYGAFGYDLAYQFDSIPYMIPRPASKRDLVLFLPDRLLVANHYEKVAQEHRYEFQFGRCSTVGVPRVGHASDYRGSTSVEVSRDHQPGQFANLVRTAKVWFKRGDLFEVVPGQAFLEPCQSRPSKIFRRLTGINPAPYGTFMNLGEDEYLVGASPEMYVRVDGKRVESCPISGTISRGKDALDDSEKILELLNSEKDNCELTMCTDVDRNDKSRVCKEGTVRVIGRRQIEMYSKVIHTVDHVEGYLREGFDAFDAFLTHTWAVTVTGAPKLAAMRFIEEHERSYRHWYGGAIGFIGFNGNLNTGLTLRTMRIKDGVAEVRAGSTLLVDSDPDKEETETELKAEALIDSIRGSCSSASGTDNSEASLQYVGKGKRVLLIDHEDSFVNTLANYVRQTGAEVLTVRVGFSQKQLREIIHEYNPSLVLLSPGPGTPMDYNISDTIGIVLKEGLAMFGVCLGLQAIVEYFGGELGTLSYPKHGKFSEVRVKSGRLFKGIPRSFTAGRYHSLYAVRDSIPSVLSITAESDDGIIMAVEHKQLPVSGVQFHPESIMTLRNDVGPRLIRNLIQSLTSTQGVQSGANCRPPEIMRL